MPNVFDTFYETYQHAIANSYIRHRYNTELARMEMVIKAREYDEGVQDTLLTDRMREFLHIPSGQDFNVNYCSLVLNAKAERLKVTGFETEGPQGELLWQWWRKNRMDRKQSILHRAALRDGDAYILVEWDKVANYPRFYFEPAYDGDGITVLYSDERRDEMECAIKQWRINTGPAIGRQRRMNVYRPDRVEKYISQDTTEKGEWMPFFDDDATLELDGKFGRAGVAWWTTDMSETGDPLGIPVIHFKHNDTGQCYGTSHLLNVMPLQDALNKAMIDLIATMDVAGFGLLVGTGTEAWTQVKVGPGAIAAVNAKSSDADLKRLAGENPAGLLAVYNALVMEIGRVSGTPLSYFQTTGHVAAEGTMKQQEVALVSQVRKTQTDFGNGWEDCMMMAQRLYNVFSSEASIDETEIIDTIWDEAESRNDMEQAQMLAVRVGQLGVSEEQAQIEMGYDEDDIARFKREKLRNQAMALRVMQANPPDNRNEARRQGMTQTENENDTTNRTNGNPTTSTAA